MSDQTKPVFKVRNVTLKPLHRLRPQFTDQQDTRQIAFCTAVGAHEERGIEDGQKFRTAAIEHISFDGRRIETANSVYELVDAAVAFAVSAE